MFERVWKESFVSDNALTRTIKDIRRAIGDDADAPHYIETVPKRGYRFIADVETPHEARPESQQPITNVSQETAGPQPEPAIIPPREPVRPEMSREAGAAFKPGRSKLTASAIICGLAVVAASLIWKNRTEHGPAETINVLRTMQITNWSGLDFYPALSPDGNSIAYSSDRNGSFEIYVKPLTPGAREIQLTSDGEQNFQPTWSPDGKLIAYCSKNRSGIWVAPASGGTAKQLTEFGSDPVWSPDGSAIAFQSESPIDLGATSIGVMPPSTLWTVISRGGDPAPITQVGTPPGGHGVPSWSPDGKRIVFVASDGILAKIWTISAEGTDLKPLTDRPEHAYDPVYSPDGQYLYYGDVSEPGNFVLYRLRVSPTGGNAIGDPIEVANTGLARIKHLTISADGKKLAYSAPTMKSSISSVPISPDSNEATNNPTPLAQDTSYRKGLPSFSSDGRNIA